MEQFDIPVVLFIFKRKKAVEVVRRIAEVKPKKLYVLADYGRNVDEVREVEECRRLVEAEVTWECDIVRRYAKENIGVYQNIGQGAMWVLRQEKWAIFLEDDNLPEVSFFHFCRDMLEKYESDTRILWVCGTNYLGKYQPADGVSYVFTRHMLPCGWASWGDKFEKFYDGNLNLCEDETVMERIGDVYFNKAVYKQYRGSWMSERTRILEGNRPVSWDYQMDFSIKAHNLFGICPCNNQIRNIGVDEASIHGGNSFNLEMTKRFCGMDSYPIEFPLRHPNTLLVDPVFEKAIAKIILYPFSMRLKSKVSKLIRSILHVPRDMSIVQYIKRGSK